MKMTIKVLAFALLAISANAIQLNWSIPNAAGAYMRDSDGAILSGATVALIMADSTATTASQITYNWDGSNWSVGGGQLVSVGTLNAGGYFTASVPILVGAGGTGAWGSSDYVGVDFLGNATSVTSQGTGAGNISRYYMIVFDGTYQSGTYAVASPAANTTVASATSSATVTFNTATGAASTWTAVPEPTSMALLALGVAAIGLRRKFRK